jgi:pyrroloquinoline quinone (PQQ) biosynthesis protein C
MEHFRNPFESEELRSANAQKNADFFQSLLSRASAHRFFSHPFLALDSQLALAPERATFILASFYQVVAPFTALLCSLAGRAPNLESRFALMDNIYEEMGCGELAAAHPKLYLRMLASLGVTEHAAVSLPPQPAIARLNRHLRAIVGHAHFSVACAVLASAEATIPASFPRLLAIARSAFGHLDTAFFDRHGARDEGHAGDASMLFSLSGQEAHFAAAERHVMLDLDYRSELLDEWQCVASAT